MKTIKSYLPIFPGFYNTIFEPDEDSCIDEGKTYDDYEWDYTEYFDRVSKACVNAIGFELADFGIDIEFENLYSPKFYNYSNDSINVRYILEDDSMDLVLEYLRENKGEFKNYLKDNFTSGPGFVSFYSPKYKTWIKEYLKDESKLKTCFGAVLNFILLNEGYEQYSLCGAVEDEIFMVYGNLKETDEV